MTRGQQFDLARRIEKSLDELHESLRDYGTEQDEVMAVLCETASYVMRRVVARLRRETEAK